MTIYVHSGVFHADDVFCAATARALGYGPDIKRVRELPDKFNKNTDIALDVGGRFASEEMIFDHHFKGGNHDGKAAIGKFWFVYGSAVVKLYALWDEKIDPERIANRVDLTLIGNIDRADIGIADWKPINNDWRHVSASGLISMMNPPFGSSPEAVSNAFETAVKAAEAALLGAICNAISFVKMEDIIASANRVQPEILILAEGGPWQEHIVDVDKYDDLLYVIFPSNRGGFQIQCVPPKLGSFEQRKPLPAILAGLRGEELAETLEIGCVSSQALFCHDGCFIGGAETLSDATAYATYAVEY